MIVTAMAEELAAFAGRALPPGVLTASTGEGPKKAALGAAALCDLHRPALLVGAGVAGALSPDLAVGEILVSRRVLDAAGDAPPPDAALAGRAAAMPGTREAAFFTSDRMLVAASEKTALAARLNEEPAAVDMESAAWARAAAARGIPYVVVRAVHDTATEDLPDYLARCFDAERGISRARVIFSALGRPGSVPRLLAMRRRVRECGERLAAFVAAFVAKSV
ncbi:MAG TPA: hypothetical protein VMN82_05200 [Thermoanaerobaculia bacterium]|nr:hypothetical protein [Thermoanaerobaculia bacterium]